MIENTDLVRAFSALTTPLVADACVRLKFPLRLAPPGIGPLPAGARMAGRALPSRHYGSVDIFLEALEAAGPGDILVIDNGGRSDEACIGDLTVREVKLRHVAGIALWGVHRDSAELEEIGLPVFSYGRTPAGPVRLEPREPESLTTARFGDLEVRRDDLVFGDADGVIFVAEPVGAEVLAMAREIGERERAQAGAQRAGRTLREQLRFEDYLAERARDASYTFRRHLRRLGGAIEE